MDTKIHTLCFSSHLLHSDSKHFFNNEPIFGMLQPITAAKILNYLNQVPVLQILLK